ncbi:hypothetical protein EDB92DRAFT_1793959 [Lactarius akahatsu]|uniref:Probable RNA-binding protein 18 n=1 Tax=Lactarius akahatsu TaxID=416441 RepID=A0AAD4QFS5_9AGAM|nr:hypothetical protein EDB92DRAFT_1793959 [Lactarius akahatsu]
MASTSTSSHLSYPAPEAPAEGSSTQRAPSPPLPVLLKNRLYVGNLHPTVDEYTLIQVFSKFGKIARLDYLFHKTGALRGKPRGYAFVEYTGERVIALEAANGKALRGRHIAVTYAHQAPLDAHHPTSRRALPQHQQQDSGRPTTLSLLKSAPSHTRTRTGDKIAQMEAKLLQLAQTPATAAQHTASAHPSLPAKPGTAHSQATVKAAVPSVPPPGIEPQLPRAPEPPSPSLPVPAALRAAPPRKSNTVLKGVKIVRKKDRVRDEGTGGE